MIFALISLKTILIQTGGHGFYDGSYPSSYNQGRSVNDLDPSFNLSKQMAQPDISPENGSFKPFPGDKDKLSSVAKIKVVVCFLGLCFYLSLPQIYMKFFLEIICDSIKGSQEAAKQEGDS